jgi:hypothetical protein
MALYACPDCGHQVSDRAAACPGCGAPGIPPTVEEWALERLRTGAPRKQVVEELVRQGSLVRLDAEDLVKRVEAEAVTAVGPTSRMKAVAFGLAALLAVLILIFLRAAAPGG